MKPNKLPVLIVNDKKYCNLGRMMGFYFRDQFQFVYVDDHDQLVKAVGANYTLGVENNFFYNFEGVCYFQSL